MRYLPILLVVFCVLPVWGSDPGEPVPAPIQYTAVVKVEGVSRSELYGRARLWFAESFKSAKDVVQLEDKEAGRILGKGLFSYEPKALSGSVPVRGPVRFTVKVFVKDGRYKYEISDFFHEGNIAASHGRIAFGEITTSDEPPQVGWAFSKKWHRARWNEIKTTIASHVAELIVSLEVAMANSAGGDDDW